MSLGYVHLFCDDGEAYDVGEVVKHAQFKIVLEEREFDHFYPTDKKCDPMKLVEKFGLPIERLTKSSHGGYGITWSGQPFPRKLLPENLQPTSKWLKKGYTGTMICFSKIHNDRRKAMGIYE